MGQRPQPGLPALPHHRTVARTSTHRAGRPARPPLRAAERPLCGHRGAPTLRGRGRGQGRGQGQGWAGPLPGAGAARSAVPPAPSRSSSRAGTRALSCAARSPPPRPAFGLPPRELPAVPPPRRRASRAAPSPALCAGARRGGRGAAAAAARAKRSPRRRRHSPIVRMRSKLHMLASDRRPASGPLNSLLAAGRRARYPAGPAASRSRASPASRAQGSAPSAGRGAGGCSAELLGLAGPATPPVFEVLQEPGGEG